ncbi:MAG TPA: MFS transporter, partial [Segetibacter sp.]
ANFDDFYPYVLCYMVLFMPTLALVNAISFRQMRDPGKEFSIIRVLGTIGWIIAGLTISILGWDKQGSEKDLANTFRMAAGASVILGIYSFFLPKTPPAKKGEKITISDLLGLDAIGLLKDRSYLLFFLSSVAICIPLSFYYNFTNLFLNEKGMQSTAGIQSLGQVSEILFMLLIPFFFIRLGVKKMLAIGMFSWGIRYVLFAYGNINTGYWMLIAGIVLHGICYDFFFVTGQIYTDRLAGERFKGAAQGLITIATYGIGMMIGSLVSGPIVDAYKTGEIHNWTAVWLIPASIAGVVVVVFMIFFRENRKDVDAANT